MNEYSQSGLGSLPVSWRKYEGKSRGGSARNEEKIIFSEKHFS
jgi:hypothetical protein